MGLALALRARVLSHRHPPPRIYDPPSPPAASLDQIEAWFASPSLVMMAETDAHWETWRELLRRSRTVGPAAHDARVAALCLQRGVSLLWTADRDFARFAPLKAVNPLVAR